MTPETDASVLVRLLEKKKRASATDLGTDTKTMEALASAGVVKKDGTIKTGRRGKPPAAWVLLEDRPEELPDLEAKRQQERQRKPVKSQEAVDEALAEIKARYGENQCGCVVKYDSITLAEIRALGSGCKDYWICSALDALRRRLMD